MYHQLRTLLLKAGIEIKPNSGSIPNFPRGIKVNGVTLDNTEATFFDGVTAGTVTASKGVAVDASKDITGFRNITATGAILATGRVEGKGADLGGILTAPVISSDEAGASSTSEEAFATTYEIAANTLAIGDVLKVRAYFILAGDSSPDAVLRATLNGQEFLSASDGITIGGVGASGDCLVVDVDIVILTTTTGLSLNMASGIAGGTPFAAPQAASLTGLDVTAAQELAFSVQYDASHASNVAELVGLTVRRN